MPLHPQAKAMIETFAKIEELDCTRLTAAEYRALFEPAAPRQQVPGNSRIEERVIESEDRPIRLRLYYPEGNGPFPLTLYIHGGGFINESPESRDGLCGALAVEARSLVVGPAYRLAPETPFPGGLEDCWFALRWIHDHADELGGNPSRLAVAGDSAGGNFAAVLAQMARTGGPRLCHQLLIYPVLDHGCATPSFTQFETGYFLTTELTKWFWRQYLPKNVVPDWRVSPLRRVDLENLPPALIITAEYDVLRDEAEAYAGRLREAGARVTLRRWTGQIHGFLMLHGQMAEADAALSEAGRALRAAFENT